jgi:hypothetical protein
MEPTYIYYLESKQLTVLNQKTYVIQNVTK